MSPPTANPEDVETFLSLLEGTLERFSVAAKGYGEDQLAARPDRKSWSANQILAHLRGCAALWTCTIFAMLVEDVPELPRMSPRDWTRAARYARRPFRDSLQLFRLQREELLAVLRELPEEAWDRTALIGGRAHSVFSQVRRMALHESGHCDQLEQVLGAKATGR